MLLDGTSNANTLLRSLYDLILGPLTAMHGIDFLFDSIFSRPNRDLVNIFARAFVRLDS